MNKSLKKNGQPEFNQRDVFFFNIHGKRPKDSNLFFDYSTAMELLHYKSGGH